MTTKSIVKVVPTGQRVPLINDSQPIGHKWFDDQATPSKRTIIPFVVVLGEGQDQPTIEYGIASPADDPELPLPNPATVEEHENGRVYYGVVELEGFLSPYSDKEIFVKPTEGSGFVLFMYYGDVDLDYLKNGGFGTLNQSFFPDFFLKQICVEPVEREISLDKLQPLIASQERTYGNVNSTENLLPLVLQNKGPKAASGFWGFADDSVSVNVTFSLDPGESANFTPEGFAEVAGGNKKFGDIAKSTYSVETSDNNTLACKDVVFTRTLGQLDIIIFVDTSGSMLRKRRCVFSIVERIVKSVVAAAGEPDQEAWAKCARIAIAVFDGEGKAHKLAYNYIDSETEFAPQIDWWESPPTLSTEYNLDFSPLWNTLEYLAIDSELYYKIPVDGEEQPKPNPNDVRLLYFISDMKDSTETNLSELTGKIQSEDPNLLFAPINVGFGNSDSEALVALLNKVTTIHHPITSVPYEYGYPCWVKAVPCFPGILLPECAYLKAISGNLPKDLQGAIAFQALAPHGEDEEPYQLLCSLPPNQGSLQLHLVMLESSESPRLIPLQAGRYATLPRLVSSPQRQWYKFLLTRKGADVEEIVRRLPWKRVDKVTPYIFGEPDVRNSTVWHANLVTRSTTTLTTRRYHRFAAGEDSWVDLGARRQGDRVSIGSLIVDVSAPPKLDLDSRAVAEYRSFKDWLVEANKKAPTPTLRDRRFWRLSGPDAERASLDREDLAQGLLESKLVTMEDLARRKFRLPVKPGTLRVKLPGEKFKTPGIYDVMVHALVGDDAVPRVTWTQVHVYPKAFAAHTKVSTKVKISGRRYLVEFKVLAHDRYGHSCVVYDPQQFKLDLGDGLKLVKKPYPRADGSLYFVVSASLEDASCDDLYIRRLEINDGVALEKFRLPKPYARGAEGELFSCEGIDEMDGACRVEAVSPFSDRIVKVKRSGEPLVVSIPRKHGGKVSVHARGRIHSPLYVVELVKADCSASVIGVGWGTREFKLGRRTQRGDTIRISVPTDIHKMNLDPAVRRWLSVLHQPLLGRQKPVLYVRGVTFSRLRA